MREAGRRISKLAPKAQMWPSVVRCEFFVGVYGGGGASSARKLYPFISSKTLFPALNETMKKQITPGLEKTKRFISEIRYGALFKAQYRFTQK